MSCTKRIQTTILVDIDTELLAEHDGDLTPPPNDISDWWGGDLLQAINAGIAEIVHEPLDVYYE